MGLDKERSHHGITRIEGLMFECKSGFGRSLLPLTPTRFEIGPESQEVCAWGLPGECRCKRFIQQLFCVAELFLSHEYAGETLQFVQSLRVLISRSFAPQGQRFAMHAFGFCQFAFAFKRRT